MTRPDWLLCESPEVLACFFCGRRIPPHAQHWKHDGDGLRECWGCRGREETESTDPVLRLVPKPEEPCSEP